MICPPHPMWCCASIPPVEALFSLCSTPASGLANGYGVEKIYRICPGTKKPLYVHEHASGSITNP